MKSVEVRTDSSYTIKGNPSHLPLFHLLPRLFSPPPPPPPPPPLLSLLLLSLLSPLSLPAMTEWIGRWRQNGWQTAKNEDVKNKEDLMRLDSLCKQINVRWVGEEYPHPRASCYHIQVGTPTIKVISSFCRLMCLGTVE